jgi:hypothetical protein
MDTRAPATRPRRKRDLPLFASPWMALFVLLRRELTTPRTEN